MTSSTENVCPELILTSCWWRMECRSYPSAVGLPILRFLEFGAFRTDDSKLFESTIII